MTKLNKLSLLLLVVGISLVLAVSSGEAGKGLYHESAN